MQRILALKVTCGLRLQLDFADGKSFEVDLTELARQGGVFEDLRDPAVFSKVRLGGDGRFIEWPGNIDLCADALREQALAGGEVSSRS